MSCLNQVTVVAVLVVLPLTCAAIVVLLGMYEQRGKKMNSLPIEFIEVLERASSALNESAYRLQDEPEYDSRGVVGDIIRTSVERSFNDAGMLIRFVERWKKAQEK